jgi:hypothetical protein
MGPPRLLAPGQTPIALMVLVPDPDQTPPLSPRFSQEAGNIAHRSQLVGVAFEDSGP